ncbi:zinc finger RNA-binding protein-like [Tachypleus tridentatus]|uniref:zinc finger RNA-binding protein-like n=1 Tax=Tachypleus tridentatus TaxID=6853 RepID=UPI003FCF40BE
MVPPHYHREMVHVLRLWMQRHSDVHITYKEHIEGQKHKKKETLLKAGNIAPQSGRGGTILRCELCDVTCTGTDAYSAHIRGPDTRRELDIFLLFFQVIKLHTKLGKPIPSSEPVVVPNPESVAVTTSGNNAGEEVKMVQEEEKTAASKKVVGTPKINFVGGTMLTDMKQKDLDKDGDEKEANVTKENDKVKVQPVGQDYLEEIKNEGGKIVTFQCKLCGCWFNDPNSKEMHMKGRRHRLQYKRKVDPELVVDSKPSARQNKIQEGKLRRQQLREELFQRQEEGRWWGEVRMLEDRLRFGEEMNFLDWQRRYNMDSQSTLLPPPLPPRSLIAGVPTSVFLPVVPPKRPDTSDDKHVLAKHSSIYPKDEELSAVQKLVTTTEKALKLVSDCLTESDRPKQLVDQPTVDEKDSEQSKEDHQPPRVLKGVMRVGVLAKGLLLTGDLNVQLVVMCTEKPTRTLLERVADNLPKQLKVVAPEDAHEVKLCVEEAAITIFADPNVTVTVTLTSHIMRGNDNNKERCAENVKDPPDVLDRQKCLDALAALRHAKWFQVKASGLHSCVVVIRVLQNLRQRLPTWERLNRWALELLVERVISSSPLPLSPGDALRRVFEAVAGGIFLPDGPGLADPCEKEPVDAVADMNNQDREDITASAQQAVRLMAFRQVHKVLGMDPLPRPKFIRRRFGRKRRRSNIPEEGTEMEDSVEKKKKENDHVQPAGESQELTE